MRARLLSLIALLGVAAAAAQERFGIVHSNYAGLDALTMNPARGAGQWPFADIRLFGADLFAWNSLVAYGSRDQRLVGELRSGLEGSAHGAIIQRGSRENHRAFADASLLGPGFSIALGRGTIGAGVRSRASMSAVGVTNELGNFIYHGFGFRPQHGARYKDESMRAIGMAWTEFGVSYAHILSARGFGMLSAGASLKYGIGHAAGALRIDAADYTVLDTMRLEVHEMDAAYGFAMPDMNAGRGFGADIGVVYERTQEEADGYMPHRSSSGCAPMRYRYRIGASLIDLGALRFSEAAGGSLSSAALSIADYNDVAINGAEGMDSLLASGTGWSRAQGLSIGLPTAASLQFDCAVGGNAYVALSAVQQVSGQRGMRLRRPNAVAITPRFETRYFEAALPVVLHEHALARPSVGLMLRFDGIVIGSDHILPFVSKRDTHALDIYFRARWMIFRSPFCKGRRTTGGVHRSGSRDMIPCELPKS